MDSFDHNPAVITDLRDALDDYDNASNVKRDELFIEFHANIQQTSKYTLE